MIVVCKHGEGKPFRPVGLEMIDEHTEIFFNLLINLFGLSIGLWVKGG